MIDASSYGQRPGGSGNTLGPIRHVVPDERGAEWACVLFWQAPTPYAPTDAVVAGKPLEVYANEGRWVVDCPDCAGAQLACRTDPRFMCVNCANVAVGGAWRRTAWPRDWAAIEAELSSRPLHNQHWRPGETVPQLRAENEAHGVEVTQR